MQNKDYHFLFECLRVLLAPQTLVTPFCRQFDNNFDKLWRGYKTFRPRLTKYCRGCVPSIPGGVDAYDWNCSVLTRHWERCSVVQTCLCCVGCGSSSVGHVGTSLSHRRFRSPEGCMVHRQRFQWLSDRQTDNSFVFGGLPEPNRACLVGVW